MYIQLLRFEQGSRGSLPYRRRRRRAYRFRPRRAQLACPTTRAAW
ncbi:MAG: hypothetical protein WKG07_33275 [Hymenobacter sp.]